MRQFSGLSLKIALAFKLVAAAFGISLLVLSLSYFANEFGYVSVSGAPGLSDTILIVAILGALLSGVTLMVELIIGIFAGWFILNSVFESRYAKLIGRIQIILTFVMITILVYQSYLLGSSSSWDIAGLLSAQNIESSSFPYALITNTAYLYLLFFGFQEIQALEREALEVTSIPVLSWIKKGRTISKETYLGIAMIGSVIVAASVNVFYAVAVYSTHPSLNALTGSRIPALYLAQSVLGLGPEVWMAVAFLIATFTTFVPAFLAASRHLSSLAEDGFMPHSISKVSWIFVLVSIGILSIAGQDFLVNITDFMVLVSLGMIALSGIWIRKTRKSRIETSDTIYLVVGLSCFFAAAAVYLFSPSVAVFGSLSIIIAYLLFDVFELGALGIQLFLGVFDVILYLFLSAYPHGFIAQNFFLFQWIGIPPLSTDLLSKLLLLSSLLLFVNFVVSFYLQRKPKLFLRSINETSPKTI